MYALPPTCTLVPCRVTMSVTDAFVCVQHVCDCCSQGVFKVSIATHMHGFTNNVSLDHSWDWSTASIAVDSYKGWEMYFGHRYFSSIQGRVLCKRIIPFVSCANHLPKALQQILIAAATPCMYVVHCKDTMVVTSVAVYSHEMHLVIIKY